MIDKEQNRKEYLDILDTYKENESLQTANIFHVYPTNEEAYPNGFYDSQFFNIVFYNTETMEKRTLKNHDGIHYVNDSIDLYMNRIYIDGSYFTRFQSVHKFVILQEILIY